MVRFIKTATNEAAIKQIAWNMIGIESGQRYIDDAGNRLAKPEPNFPMYVAEDAMYPVRSTNNTIYVGINVDIPVLAQNLAAATMRLQPADHFCRQMPIVGIVTTVLIKPTQSSTEVDPTRPVGRAIHTRQPANATNFYNWTIRPISELPYDDPARITPQTGVLDPIETLGSIVWDVDDIFVHEHGDQPIVLNIRDFRAIAEGRLRILYEKPIVGSNLKTDTPINSISIIAGVKEPGQLILQKVRTGQVIPRSLIGLNVKNLIDTEDDTSEIICANGYCKCIVVDNAYSDVGKNEWRCLRCLAHQHRETPTDTFMRKRLTLSTREKALSKLTPFEAAAVDDVAAGITKHTIGGTTLWFGKKYAYISNAEPILFGGPPLFDHIELGGRTVYVADIYG